MAAITKFASDIDGTVFDTQEEQHRHDTGLKNKAEIDAFLDAEYPVTGPKPGPSRAIAGKAIVKFLASRELNGAAE